MQYTLKKEAACRGVGVHSGAPVNMRMLPAEADSGIRFIRTDIQDRENMIPARWDRVVDTRLCTVLANHKGVEVGTVEHLMAALRGCGVDNVVIELDGPEVPIMDGSSDPFIDIIEAAGLQKQDMPRKTIRIMKEIRVQDGDKHAVLRPDNLSRVACTIEYDTDLIKRQSYQVTLVNGNFREEISAARTFGFLHEVEYLRENGFAMGGSLDNAIVIDRNEVMNEDGLRFDDEFARHKVLDAIGDLYLAGVQIQGSFEGFKAGHEMNNKLLRALFADRKAWKYVVDNMAQPAEAKAYHHTAPSTKKPDTVLAIGA